eukprot:GHVP01039343.1.p1 GENE.GHVP01039343.1~~GHVP01039343.1.p1  ORF type:complete len:158 (-),score=16.31 GHVP01039343.1:68-541(-)
MDVSCVIFDKSCQLIDVAYYNKLQVLQGSVIHSGDNRSGEGDGDDEMITVMLDSLPGEVDKLIFVINMYSKGQTFRSVETAYCRVFELHNDICRFNMKDFLDCEALIVAQLSRGMTRWDVQALGIPAKGRNFKESFKELKKVAGAKRVSIIDCLWGM